MMSTTPPPCGFGEEWRNLPRYPGADPGVCLQRCCPSLAQEPWSGGRVLSVPSFRHILAPSEALALGISVNLKAIQAKSRTSQEWL